MASIPDVGSSAPEISLPSTEGHFSLHERLEESSVLLVFYPKDKTLVCTRQLCNYRDNLSMFTEYGVQVVGINQDSLQSHEAFASEFKFSFPLVSDVDREASNAYGALLDLFKLKRVLVLIGQDGRIWWRHSELRVFHKDAEELQKIIEELRGAEV